MISHRLERMRGLLSPRGSLLVHVDPRVSSHLRLVLDEIFGPRAFVNEIVWCYGGGGAPRRHYPRKHDNILWYARGKEWIFNRQFRPYTPGTAQRGLTRVKGPRYKLRPEGAGLDDWWQGKAVQKILSPTARENLKYPTQKPEGLLERILLGHSLPESLVADFFCGAGTTLAVAERLGRGWIGCDLGRRAVQVTRKRLLGLPGCRTFEVLDLAPPQAAPPPPRVRAQVEASGLLSLQACLTAVAAGDGAPPPEGGWEPLVDSWGVDWDYRGGAPRLTWIACAGRGEQRVALRTPEHCCSGPGRRRVAIKLVDVHGGEALQVHEVQVGKLGTGTLLENKP
jgi:hypothetical protein